MEGSTISTTTIQSKGELQPQGADARSRSQSVLVIALLTTVTLTGSVVLAFWAIELNVHYFRNSSDLVRIVGGLSALILTLLLGGLLWGAGVGWWSGARIRDMAKGGAKGWTGMAFLFALLLEFVNGTQTFYSQALRISGHAVLTGSFALSVLLVVLVSVRGIWKRVESQHSRRRVGLACAGAAVIGYVLFDIGMQMNGWVLGSRFSVMVPVMKVGLTGAALFGGAVLGWFLADVRASATDHH